jgi:hypothetical protein
MEIRFRELNPFNCWIWMRFGSPLGPAERGYVETLMESWFFLGKLGAFNAENLQCHEEGVELGWMGYDLEAAERALKQEQLRAEAEATQRREAAMEAAKRVAEEEEAARLALALKQQHEEDMRASHEAAEKAAFDAKVALAALEELEARNAAEVREGPSDICFLHIISCVYAQNTLLNMVI